MCRKRSECKAMPIRCASKALIIKDDHILLNRCRNDSQQIYYDLPGGGQHPYETLEEALIREVKEETGNTVRVKRFAGLAEEIYTNEQLRQTYPDYTHRIIHFFVAEVCGDQRDPISEKDYQMEDSEWIPISAVVTLPRLCPSRLQPILQDVLRTNQPVYLGTELIDES